MKDYPKFDGKGYKYVKHPVCEDGDWYAADLVEGGYVISPLAIPMDSKAACEKACKCHNNYEFDKQYTKKVLDWSMG